MLCKLIDPGNQPVKRLKSYILRQTGLGECWITRYVTVVGKNQIKFLNTLLETDFLVI